MSDAPAYVRSMTRAGKLPLSVKFFQGIGALPDTYMNFAFNTFLLFFYNQVLHMPAVLASIAITIALVIDAFVDPMVGSYSDSLHSKLGRRHPLMYAAAVPLGISLALSFTPPASASNELLFAWLTVTLVATRISMTYFLIPWSALYAELSDDYAERTSIVTFRYLCGWIGAVVLTFCVWTFIFPSTPQYSPGHLNPHGYKLLAPVVAVLVTLSALLTTHLTRKEIPYLLQPVAAAPPFRIGRAFREMKLALSNRSFRMLFFGLLTASMIGGTGGALDIYMTTYFWGLAPEQLRWFTIAILGSFAAFLLAAPLQSNFDKKHILLACFAFVLVDAIALIALRLIDVLPANHEVRLLYILIANAVVATVAATLLFIMFASMVADALDAQELETGRRQEGVFSAALAFSGKATSGFGVLAGGLILDYVLVFPRGIAPSSVDPQLVMRVGIVAGIVVPALYFIPFYFVTRYRVTRAEHARISAALLKRRAASADGSAKSPAVDAIALQLASGN